MLKAQNFKLFTTDSEHFLCLLVQTFEAYSVVQSIRNACFLMPRAMPRQRMVICADVLLYRAVKDLQPLRAFLVSETNHSWWFKIPIHVMCMSLWQMNTVHKRLSKLKVSKWLQNVFRIECWSLLRVSIWAGILSHTILGIHECHMHLDCIVLLVSFGYQVLTDEILNHLRTSVKSFEWFDSLKVMCAEICIALSLYSLCTKKTYLISLKQSNNTSLS